MSGLKRPKMPFGLLDVREFRPVHTVVDKPKWNSSSVLSPVNVLTRIPRNSAERVSKINIDNAYRLMTKSCNITLNTPCEKKSIFPIENTQDYALEPFLKKEKRSRTDVKNTD